MPHIKLTLGADTPTETHTVYLRLQRLIINLPMATRLRLRLLTLLPEITTVGIHIMVLLITEVHAMGIIGTGITIMEITATWDAATIRHHSLSTSKGNMATHRHPLLLPTATTQFTTSIKVAITTDQYNLRLTSRGVKHREGGEGICPETRQTY